MKRGYTGKARVAGLKRRISQRAKIYRQHPELKGVRLVDFIQFGTR